MRFQLREEEQQQQQQEQQEGSSFWARFWRRSVLQGHCVSLSGRVRFSFGRKSSSSNRSSRRVLCLIVQTIVQTLVENYCFSRVSEGTLGSFWARFWRRSGPCPAGCVCSFGRKSSSSSRSSRRVLCLICLIVLPVV